MPIPKTFSGRTSNSEITERIEAIIAEIIFSGLFSLSSRDIFLKAFSSSLEFARKVVISVSPNSTPTRNELSEFISKIPDLLPPLDF